MIPLRADLVDALHAYSDDLHALRHTFGTHLARAGVALRVAIVVMRHSSLELTMDVYTDPALLDVAGAVEALSAFGSPAGKVADQPSSVAV